MNNISISTIIITVLVAVVTTILSLVVRYLLNSQGLITSSQSRGSEYFKLYFFGPDLAILSLGLVASSKVISDVLNGYKMSSNYGDLFSTYFWGLIGLILIILLVNVGAWITLNELQRQFQVTPTEQTLKNNSGTDTVLTTYNIDLRNSLNNELRGPILRVTFCNLLGFVSIVFYVAFIYGGFILK
jgi:hypothetical protein